MNDTAIHRMVEQCRNGSYAPLLGRMTSGWAVLGQSQFLTGYCLLLPDPVVPHLNAMEPVHRSNFLIDMAALGDAVLAVTSALRINYAMFGNVEPALHAHVVPRFTHESEPLRTAHPWAYDWSAAPPFNIRQHGELQRKLREKLAANLHTIA